MILTAEVVATTTTISFGAHWKQWLSALWRCSLGRCFHFWVKSARQQWRQLFSYLRHCRLCGSTTYHATSTFLYSTDLHFGWPGSLGTACFYGRGVLACSSGVPLHSGRSRWHPSSAWKESAAISFSSFTSDVAALYRRTASCGFGLEYESLVDVSIPHILFVFSFTAIDPFRNVGHRYRQSIFRAPICPLEGIWWLA